MARRKLWSGAVDERGASYMAEAKGGVQGAPAVERERETDPAHLGYAGVALGVMTAISRDERRTMILNVRNRGTIAGLPDDAVVEVPAMVDANGVHPLTLDTQPDLHQLGLMQQVKAVERHTISAATPDRCRKRSRRSPCIRWSTRSPSRVSCSPVISRPIPTSPACWPRVHWPHDTTAAKS